MEQQPGNAAMARVASQSTCTITAQSKAVLTLQTETSRLTTKRLSANEFKVSFAAPQFDPEMVPFKPTGQSRPEGSKYHLRRQASPPLNLGVQRW